MKIELEFKNEKELRTTIEEFNKLLQLTEYYTDTLLWDLCEKLEKVLE